MLWSTNLHAESKVQDGTEKPIWMVEECVWNIAAKCKDFAVYLYK